VSVDLTNIGITPGEIWRVDPHLPSAGDVEILETGDRNGRLSVMVRAVLPGGFTGKETRPIELRDFVQHAVRVYGVEDRQEYDRAGHRRPFVR
jgi:hypothetical protein